MQGISSYKQYIPSWSELSDQMRKELKAPSQTYAVLEVMLTEGAYMVNTSFDYKDKTYHFTTHLQLDADVINYIPDTKCTEEEFIRLWKENHILHLQKIHEVTQKLKGSEQLLERCFDAMLLSANALPFFALLDGATTQEGLTSTLMAGSSFLTRKYLKHIIIDQLLKIVFKFIQWKIGSSFKLG
ncbi:hypothetical protein [Algivirga pacifica]|uniref:Uncharacterized protein n=1 Tax=Algivirga pacifica TaxID=1162670 RepID=A0ABP9D850_9BACT